MASEGVHERAQELRHVVAAMRVDVVLPVPGHLVADLRASRPGRTGWSRPGCTVGTTKNSSSHSAPGQQQQVAARARRRPLPSAASGRWRPPCAAGRLAAALTASSTLGPGRGVLAGVEQERVVGLQCRSTLSPTAEPLPRAGVLLEDRQLLAPRHPHEVLRAHPDEADVGDHARRPARWRRRRCVLARVGSACTFSGRTPTQTSPLASPARAAVPARDAGRRGRRARSVGAVGAGRPCRGSGWTGRGSWRRTSCAGARRAPPGAPICSIRPSFITATVSAMVMASSWSWVTWTKVMPTSVWIRLSSICIWRRSLRSRAPSGSSSSSTCGWLISARASATRCCWPPESWAGRRLAKLAELDQLEHLVDLGVDVLAALARCSPNATFSEIVRCGNSA